jgi:hypothetical protein
MTYFFRQHGVHVTTNYIRSLLSTAVTLNGTSEERKCIVYMHAYIVIMYTDY